MDYKQEIIDIARFALSNGEGEDAGFGMYNFDIYLSSFRGSVLNTSAILQVYPHEDSDWYGDIHLLVYEKLDNGAYDNEDYKFTELTEDEQKEIVRAFKTEYTKLEQQPKKATNPMLKYVLDESAQNTLKGVSEFAITLSSINSVKHTIGSFAVNVGTQSKEFSMFFMNKGDAKRVYDTIIQHIEDGKQESLTFIVMKKIEVTQQTLEIK